MNPALQQRIQQWEQMVREAPDDMACFSLGNAYKEADRPEDAIGAYRQAVTHNPKMSRAWHMLGDMLHKHGRNPEAIEALTEGYKVAAAKGDAMPLRSIAHLLEKLGAPLPEVAGHGAPAPAAAEDLGPDAILDRRSGTQQKRLDGPPMKGKTGAFIAAHFGQVTWREWIGMGTKVINELRLDFSNTRHQDQYEEQMLQWLGITPEEIEAWVKEQGK